VCPRWLAGLVFLPLLRNGPGFGFGCGLRGGQSEVVVPFLGVVGDLSKGFLVLVVQEPLEDFALRYCVTACESFQGQGGAGVHPDGDASLSVVVGPSGGLLGAVLGLSLGVGLGCLGHWGAFPLLRNDLDQLVRYAVTECPIGRGGMCGVWFCDGICPVLVT